MTSTRSWNEYWSPTAGRPALSKGSARSRDELIDPPLEDRHRHRAAAQHRLVEAADLEAVAQGLPRSLAQLEEPPRAHPVRQGLAGHVDRVAQGLRVDLQVRLLRVLLHE